MILLNCHYCNLAVPGGLPTLRDEKESQYFANLLGKMQTSLDE